MDGSSDIKSIYKINFSRTDNIIDNMNQAYNAHVQMERPKNGSFITSDLKNDDIDKNYLILFGNYFNLKLLKTSLTLFGLYKDTNHILLVLFHIFQKFLPRYKTVMVFVNSIHHPAQIMKFQLLPPVPTRAQ